MKKAINNLIVFFEPLAGHLAIASVMTYLIFAWMEHNDKNSVDSLLNHRWFLLLAIFSLAFAHKRKLSSFGGSILDKLNKGREKYIDKHVNQKNLQILIIVFFVTMGVLYIKSFSQNPESGTLARFAAWFFALLLLIFFWMFTKKAPAAVWDLNKISLSRFFPLAIFLIFAFIQIAGIFGSEVGTDEGNALYMARLMIIDNLRLYKDFWSREPGGVLMILPFFELFGISITTLRAISAVINISSLALIFFGIKKSLGGFYATIALLAGFLLLNNTFNIYAGIFYHFWVFLSLLIIFLCIKLASNKAGNNFLLMAIALTTGWSILVYKAFQIFLIIIPALLFVKYRPDLKIIFLKILTFLAVSFIPVGMMFLYYSAATSFSHIYRIILGDVLFNYLLILTAFLLLWIFTAFKITKKALLYFNFKNLYFFANSAAILITIGYIFSDPEAAPSFWSGLLLEGGCVLFTFFIFNLIYFKNRRRLILSSGYFLIMFLVTLLGFGDKGFFSGVTIGENLVFLTTLLFSAGWILYSNPLGAEMLALDPKLKSVLIITVFLYVSFFVGGYIMPARILMLLPVYPILLVFLLNFFRRNKISRVQLAIFLAANLFFLFYTNYLFLSRNTSYTVYSNYEVSQITEYIQSHSSPNDLVFSADMAILSELDRTNVALFTSPWIFRETGIPLYNYPGIEKYSVELSLSKEKLAQKIETEKPKFIFGNDRLTFKTFFDSNDDPHNKPLEELLKKNYALTYQTENIKVYELN